MCVEREREDRHEDGMASKVEKLERLSLTHEAGPAINAAGDPKQEDIVIEYVPAPVIPVQDGQLMDAFANVISKFALPRAGVDGEPGYADETDMATYETNGMREETGEGEAEDHSFDEEEAAPESMGLSKKQLKKFSRMSIAELKQYATYPEVVEWEDVTAPDPRLLVDLKATRHTVPVPRHWSHKRKYLAGKRGYLKPPFELPAFIRDTGITELRETMRAQDATKRIKVKAREKMHPKLGRISVDYELLHDAFFKYQTKPPMTVHGDLYYEGRELEGARTGKKPGFLSEELRAALGLTSHLMPPPWLQQMQRYGPPPAYPHMRIPGLNAPIPEGAQWGYHPGGWGRPPSDHFLRETAPGERPGETNSMLTLLNPVERNLWGELEPDEEEEQEEEENRGEGGTAGEENERYMTAEGRRRLYQGQGQGRVDELLVRGDRDGGILTALSEEQIERLAAATSTTNTNVTGAPDYQDTITMNIPMPSEPLEVRKERRRR